MTWCNDFVTTHFFGFLNLESKVLWFFPVLVIGSPIFLVLVHSKTLVHMEHFPCPLKFCCSENLDFGLLH